MNYDGIHPSEHREISELIPWYVNATIGLVDRQKLDAHFLTCAACRDEMLQERRIHQAMRADSGIGYLPAASFKRLQARLDGAEVEPDPQSARPALGRLASVIGYRVNPRIVARSIPWRRRVAASIAVLAVALSLVSADKWYRLRSGEFPANYHTVTTSAPRAPNEVIRAVFSQTTTLVELQTILDEAQLRIISGPTEAGVYSLAANSDHPVSSSLALLRRHVAVRFAESTQLSAPPAAGESP